MVNFTFEETLKKSHGSLQQLTIVRRVKSISNFGCCYQRF